MSDARHDGDGRPADGPRVPADAPVSESVLDTVLDADTVVEAISVDAPPVVRPVAGGRHEARERAVHLLYESRIKDLGIDEVLAAQVLAPDEYAGTLVRGVVAHEAELDALIGRLVRGWTLERMATLDLVVLRVACSSWPTARTCRAASCWPRPSTWRVATAPTSRPGSSTACWPLRPVSCGPADTVARSSGIGPTNNS